MDTQSFVVSTHLLQTLVFASTAVVVLAFFPIFNYKLKVSKLPLLSDHSSGEKQKQRYITSAREIFADGFRKFKDAVYRIALWDNKDIIVVPPSMLAELRKLPDDVISFSEATSEVLQAKHTGVRGDQISILAHSVQADLTPALTRLNADISEEIESAMTRFLPPCEKATEVHIHDVLANVVAQTSGRLFVGPELCQDPDYIETSVQYSLDIFIAAAAVKRVRPWLRPFLGSRVPEVARLRERERRAMEMMGSVIRQRKEAEKSDPSWQKPDDMMQWLMARSDDNLAMLTNRQLVLTFAAIHTTTTAATNIIYTLAATPEYIPGLREEIRTAMAANGGSLTAKALQQMLKLDSYMREVNRYYPIGLLTFMRKVLKTFTLSNGQILPAGCTLGAIAFAAYDDPNPDIEANKFDGYRHFKERMKAASTGAQARTQFVSANEDNLMFGYGRHACPGRFFAANEIKMILAKLLLDYDISMPDGSTGLENRHAQKVDGSICAPDPSKGIVLKKVQI